MERLTNKKDVNRLIFLFTITYMVSYITRINYGAIISEMELATGFGRSHLSMALTGSFITYGLGQIISGVLGDRFSPKKLVTTGLIITILMNILIPVCNSPYLMLAVWCVNGFAQSFMWPPIVRLMTAFLSDDDYKKASVRVSWGSSFGTIFVYTVAPLVITLLSWKAVFYVSAVMGIIMCFIWNRYSYDTEPVKRQQEEKKYGSVAGVIFNPVMICVMLVIVLQGMLRDGVTTWMPSYISETFNLSSAVSILTGVVLPIFSIISFQVASRLYRRTFTSPVSCAGVMFGVGAISALVLYLFSSYNAAFSVAMATLLTGCVHGVNLMLVCMVPAFFRKYGSVSTVSGIINSCTYVGSAISTYGIALLSENFGWSTTLLAWAIIAVTATLICVVNIKPWRNKYQSDED